MTQHPPYVVNQWLQAWQCMVVVIVAKMTLALCAPIALLNPNTKITIIA